MELREVFPQKNVPRATNMKTVENCEGRSGVQRSGVLIPVWRVFPQKDRGIAASGFCLTLIKGGWERNEVSGDYYSQAKNSEELPSLTEIFRL